MKKRMCGRRATGTACRFRPSVWGLFLALWGLLCPVWLPAQVTRQLWVGESFTCDASSAAMGLTSDVSWSVSGGYIQLSGSGMYRRATVTQYFSGTSTVTCTWKYRLYSGDTWRTQSRSWTFTCQDNPVSIHPTELTLSVGETANLSYSLAYSTNASSAGAYFSSANPSVASVTSSGLVTAESPGTAYINVYSKVSANSPYCVVRVRSVPVESASLPSRATVVAGETVGLTLTLYPENGTVESQSWQTSDASVATVDSRGRVRGVRPGTVEVHCVVNGTVRTNATTVTVTPATLELTADHEGGLVVSGTTVRLTASDPEATIYYTTDGSEPTSQSMRYTGPVVIDHSLTLKAVAKHADYYDSPVLTLRFEATSLSLASTYPAYGTDSVNRETVPALTYNQPVAAGEDFDAIELRRAGDDGPVAGRVVVTGSTLYYVTDERLAGGEYTLTVPVRAVRTATGEPNRGETLTFTAQEAPPSVVQYVCAFGGVSYLLDTNGDLWAWGAPSYGPFGSGLTEPVLTPVKIMGNVAKIRVGSSGDAAAITRNGDLYRWGLNSNGGIGDGTTTDRLSPVRVLSGVADVALGYSSTYAVKTDGTLWVWGRGDYGALGTNSTTNQRFPMRIMDNVQAVYADYYRAFALKRSGELMAWGYNVYGMLGLGTKSDRWTPAQVMLDDVDTVVAAGSSTYALTKSGALWAWGGNTEGAIGTGTTEEVLSPRKIMDGVRLVAGGRRNVWAIKEDGSLWAWGANEFGQQGTGATDDVLAPRKVMDGVRKVASDYATVVLREDGTVWTCGYELANGKAEASYGFDCLRSKGDGVDVETNGWQSGYTTTYGSLWTWGSGHLGNGTRGSSMAPVHVFPLASPEIESCALSAESLELPQHGEAVLQVLAEPVAAPLYVTWVSEDRTVATVSARGVIEGVNPGTTRVTAYVSNFADSPDFIGIYTCDVTVNEVPVGIATEEVVPFAVRVVGNRLRVEGLAAGEKVRLYDASGRLCGETTATGSGATLEAGPRGVYVVRTDGGRAAKVAVR